MATLNRDGVQIYYEVTGDHGPVVLLSHGYGLTSQMWEGQRPALAGCRTIVWDMRGHGRSDSPADPAQYSQALTVGDMAALLDAVGEPKAVVAGLSLGGYMSLAFHAIHPQRVRALMLFDTGPGFRSDAARGDWNKYAESRATMLERDGLSALGKGVEVRVNSQPSAQGLAHAARGMLVQADASVIDSLPHIAVPTLVLVGAQDKNYLAGTDYMAGKIAGAHKVVIEGAGHTANLDQPQAFNRVVQEFLLTLSAGE